MSKHTKGKWNIVWKRLEDRDVHTGVLQSDDDGDIWQVCEVFSAAGSREEYDTDNESEANVRLIAAAPEMYELLKSMLDTCEYAHMETAQAIQSLLNRIDP